jgi:hypothetical protein
MLRSMAVAVVLFVGVAHAEEGKNDLAQLQDLLNRAREAKDAGRFDEAISLGREALSKQFPQNLRALRGDILYNIACLEARRGRIQPALAELGEALGAGFADWSGAQNDPDLANLRKTREFRRLVQQMKEEDVRRRVFRVTAWDNPDLGWSHLHSFNDPKSDDLNSLRETYRLAEVIAGKKSELDQQLAVLAWVHGRWRHSGLDEPSRPDAKTILAEAATGRRFRCVEYSITLAETLQAVGFPARVLGLSRDGVSHGTGKGHVVTEAWNNELGKWIVLDGQNNATWRHGSRYLDADEVRQLLLAGRGSDVRFSMGSSPWRTWKGAQDEPAQREEWIAYFHHLNYVFQNTIEKEKAQKSRVSLVRPDEGYELLFQGSPGVSRAQTSDRMKVYPQLNRVHFDVAYGGRPGPLTNALEFKLSHSAPWFAKYRVTVDGAEQEVASDTFVWNLKPGENRIVFRVLDGEGRQGPASSMTVTYFPPRLEQGDGLPASTLQLGDQGSLHLGLRFKIAEARLHTVASEPSARTPTRF